MQSKYRGMPIINDETPGYLADPPPGQSRGLDLSLRTEEGYRGVAEPFPRSLLIPRSEWQARIKEREQLRSRLVDLCDARLLIHQGRRAHARECRDRIRQRLREAGMEHLPGPVASLATEIEQGT